MNYHISQLFQLLETQGQADYIGECISQLEHSLQTAMFAAQETSDEQLIIAALLHDIGQFIPLNEIKDCQKQLKLDMVDEKSGSSVGRFGHDVIGQIWLASHGWPQKVCELVGAHVTAKRYLTATRPEYLTSLSKASQASLRMQGGPFSLEEVAMFEKNCFYKDMVHLRLWDDHAKIEGLRTPPLSAYRAMAERVLKGTK